MSLRSVPFVVVAALLLVSCAHQPTPPRATGSSSVISAPAPAPTSSGPVVQRVTAADLGATWHPDCPVTPEQLRRVELDYVGFDGKTHRGALVVNEALVADVIAIFADLARQRYPIATMQTVEHYPNADDEASMEDNNTSAFNCRPLPSGRAWSLHAYGRAVDVNPLLNPYITKSGDLQPKTAAQYLDRNRTDPGILHAADPAVRAFTDRGWTWGGSWHNPIDYQHFERP
ncbi:M15 family metallopeptidase [Mycobacterium sp. DL592]|uniref:M15 family metallopeptidase n=1 Tax=Mycobacterium sp. DL592 TaxID=2675524 RepID=UPI00141E240D|nr:M15 family metallopeptidase [Mycobacterium sp. DL592]